MGVVAANQGAVEPSPLEVEEAFEALEPLAACLEEA